MRAYRGGVGMLSKHPAETGSSMDYEIPWQDEIIGPTGSAKAKMQCPIKCLLILRDAMQRTIFVHMPTTAFDL